MFRPFVFKQNRNGVETRRLLLSNREILNSTDFSDGLILRSARKSESFHARETAKTRLEKVKKDGDREEIERERRKEEGLPVPDRFKIHARRSWDCESDCRVPLSVVPYRLFSPGYRTNEPIVMQMFADSLRSAPSSWGNDFTTGYHVDEKKKNARKKD